MVAATTREVAARREFLVTKVMARCCCYGATELGCTLVAFASCEEVWRPMDALFVKTKNEAFRILHGRYHTFRMKACQFYAGNDLRRRCVGPTLHYRALSGERMLC